MARISEMHKKSWVVNAYTKIRTGKFKGRRAQIPTSIVGTATLSETQGMFILRSVDKILIRFALVDLIDIQKYETIYKSETFSGLKVTWHDRSKRKTLIFYSADTAPRERIKHVIRNQARIAGSVFTGRKHPHKWKPDSFFRSKTVGHYPCCGSRNRHQPGCMEVSTVHENQDDMEEFIEDVDGVFDIDGFSSDGSSTRSTYSLFHGSDAGVNQFVKHMAEKNSSQFLLGQFLSQGCSELMTENGELCRSGLETDKGEVFDKSNITAIKQQLRNNPSTSVKAEIHASPSFLELENSYSPRSFKKERMNKLNTRMRTRGEGQSGTIFTCAHLHENAENDKDIATDTITSKDLEGLLNLLKDKNGERPCIIIQNYYAGYDKDSHATHCCRCGTISSTGSPERSASRQDLKIQFGSVKETKNRIGSNINLNSIIAENDDIQDQPEIIVHSEFMIETDNQIS